MAAVRRLPMIAILGRRSFKLPQFWYGSRRLTVITEKIVVVLCQRAAMASATAPNLSTSAGDVSGFLETIQFYGSHLISK